MPHRLKAQSELMGDHENAAEMTASHLSGVTNRIDRTEKEIPEIIIPDVTETNIHKLNTAFETIVENAEKAYRNAEPAINRFMEVIVLPTASVTMLLKPR